jgi:hypothetical protein
MTPPATLVIRELPPEQFHSPAHRARHTPAVTAVVAHLVTPLVTPAARETVWTCLCAESEKEDVSPVADAFRHGMPGETLLEFAHRMLTESVTKKSFFLAIGASVTLDRAAIDELFVALAQNEKHGVAIPRTNAPGVGLLPRRLPTDVAAPIVTSPRSPDLSSRVFSVTSVFDDRVKVMPFADGEVAGFVVAPFLNYFPDVRVRTGATTTLRDYSILINEMGFSTILCNRALALVPENSSHAATVEGFEREWDAYIAHVANFWNRNEVGPIDFFAPHLVEYEHNQPRVLVDVSALPPIVNGTSKNALTFLRTLETSLEQGRFRGDITVLIRDEARDFFGLTSPVMHFCDEESVGEQTFDVGLCVTPVRTMEQLLRLNRSCVRWVVCHLDIIALRALPFLSQNVSSKQVVHNALKFADYTIFISQSALTDATAFFPDLDLDARRGSMIIHEGADSPSTSEILPPDGGSPALSFSEETISQLAPGYVLLVGNHDPHKQLAKAESSLTGSGMRIVSFGGRITENADVVTIPSGHVSAQAVTQLYANAAVVVFPSVYEGFGLPIAAAALASKPCVLYETPVAHEVAELMNLSDRVLFFSDFGELATTVQKALTLPHSELTALRTIDDFNEDIIETVRQALLAPPPLERLKGRWAHFTTIETLAQALQDRMLAERPHEGPFAKIVRVLRGR